MNEPFSISGAIREGWHLTKKHLGFLLGYVIILFFLSLILSTAYYRESALWPVLIWIVMVLAKMGFCNSALLITKGLSPDFTQLYQNWRLFLSWIVAFFCFSVLFVVGLILFVVPGCYVWAKYGLFPFFLLDRNLGPFEALKQSGEATKGMRWHLFLLFLACTALNILGALLLGIGLLFTIPITMLALAYVYRKITREQGFRANSL